MDDQLVKIVLFALIILGSIIKSATDKKRKDEMTQRRSAAPRQPKQPAEQSEGRQGKSLADWIEEIRRESDAKVERPAAPPEPVAVEPEEVVVRHRRHEAPRPTGKIPQESIKPVRETEHVFQKAARPSVDIDEDEAPLPRHRKTEFREAQVARVAPRYESEHGEHVVESDPRARKAQRARRARRATREGAELDDEIIASTGIGDLSLHPRDLRKAFILKEILEPPLALRRTEERT